jgi:hypothetical protein
MGTRHIAEGEYDAGDDCSPDQAYANMRYCPAELLIDHDSACTAEDQSKCPDKLSQIFFHTYLFLKGKLIADILR